MFSSEVVDTLSDNAIEEIAAEDESTRLERQRLEEKVTALQSLLERLRRLDRHHLAGSIIQSHLQVKRLTPPTDVRRVDEQIATGFSAIENQLDSDADSSGAGEQSSNPIEEEHVNDNGSDVGVPEPAFDSGRAATPVDGAEDWAPLTKKAKKKKHQSASIYE